MAKVIHPLLGDFVLKGVVALCLLFVIGLLFDAWWQKRQARLMREWSQGKFPNSAHGIGPLHVFFKRFCGKRVALLVIASMVIGALVLMKKKINVQAKNSAGEDDIAAYATNFQGEATRPVPMASTQLPDSNKTILSWNQSVVRSGKATLQYEAPPSSDSMSPSTTNREPEAVTSSTGKSPDQKP